MTLEIQINRKQHQLKPLIPEIEQARKQGATWEEVRCALLKIGIEFGTASALRESYRRATGKTK